MVFAKAQFPLGTHHAVAVYTTDFGGAQFHAVGGDGCTGWGKGPFHACAGIGGTTNNL